MKSYPPGMLALSAGESARFSSCYASIVGLTKPSGSVNFFAASLSLAENWNIAARKFLERPELEWMFLMNDDHIYQPDTLVRLLDHEKDVVTGLYVSRSIPFDPIIYDAIADSKGSVTRYPLQGYTEEITTGLVPIVACGDGCMLVRRNVFETIGDPWWSFGEIEQDKCDHDISFCRRIREAGFDIFVDLETTVDHVTPFAIRPIRNQDGSWSVQLRDRMGKHIEVITTLSPAETQALLQKEVV